MRKPRPESFDPDYQKTPAQKPEVIDLTGVVPILQKSAPTAETPVRTEKRAEFRTEARAEKRTFALPIKRATKRYSFEFYIDQLTRIRQLKIETEMAGEHLSMSEIVRQALDDYLVRHPAEPYGNPFGRNDARKPVRKIEREKD